MDDHDDFNSSDIEMPEQRPNPHAQLGRASIEAMLQNTLEHRVQSKVKSAQLTFVHGAPGTRTDRSRWANRFSAFCEKVLKHKPGTTPTGKDIERFLFEIVDLLRGRVSQIDPEISAPSYSMVQGGLRRLLGSLQFDFKNFQLSKHDRIRITNVMEKLEQDGKLTKDPKRERRWLGAFVVHKLATAIFEDALTSGTLSWDMVLSKVLSIVLTGALITRAGDIARNAAYKELECMLWGHITLKIVRKDGVEVLQGLFSIFNEKGKKKTHLEARKVPLTALMESKYNTVCPVALLVIFALRIGAVDSTTIEDLLMKARDRADKTVIWVKPKAPVLCAFDIHTHQLIESKPASGTQLTRNFKQAAELAGIAEDVILHDVRRGGFRDLANLKTAVGGRLEGVAEAAGHSASTRTEGITKQYTGHLKEDTWKQRLDENTELEDFGVNIVEQPFKKRRLDTQAVTDYCDANGLISSKAGDRVKAQKMLRTQAKSTWAEKGRAGTLSQIGGPGSANDESPGLANASEGNSNLDPQLFVTDDVDTEDSELSDEAQMQAVDLLVSGAGIKNPEEFALMSEGTDTKSSLLTAEPYEFIDIFSRINIVRSLKALDKASFIISGGSRDEPSRFKFSCPNAVFGCPATSFSEQELGFHVQICTLTSHEKYKEFVALEQSKKFICDREGCKSRFGTAKDLKRHKKDHDAIWVPKVCNEGECSGETLYKSKTSWASHKRSAHGSYRAQSCQVPRCEVKTVYDKKPSLLTHMSKVHQIKGEAAKAYVL